KTLKQQIQFRQFFIKRWLSNVYNFLYMLELFEVETPCKTLKQQIQFRQFFIKRWLSNVYNFLYMLELFE
ncbi:hypothetical protein CDE51_12290, partial [Pasteurella multocida]